MKHLQLFLTLAAAIGPELTSAALRNLQGGFDLASCTPVAQSNFNIETRNMGNPNINPAYIEAFELAAERWQKVIVGDLMGFQAGAVDDWFQGIFPTPYNGEVDDVIIGYEVSNGWDGPGGTLGRAGGVFSRIINGRPVSAISGIMQFDIEDFDRMAADDVKVIILHEMGHVLGLVSATGTCNVGCNPDNSAARNPYQCPRATQEYAALESSRLLLENQGGPGTACAHWREQSFRSLESSELMTGFFEANLLQPLSLVTAAALDDMGGYEVDYCGADPWPAGESSVVERYEIFRPSMNISMGEGMEDVEPSMGMDENGNPVRMTMETSSVSTVLRLGMISMITSSLAWALL